MTRFYEPDLGTEPDSPFARDASSKLVRRSYWMDMPDGSLVMVMTKGIGANLTNDEKKAHLIDLKQEHLIEQVDDYIVPAAPAQLVRVIRKRLSNAFDVIEQTYFTAHELGDPNRHRI